MSEHNARQLLRALAEIDDLREENKSAFRAGYWAGVEHAESGVGPGRESTDDLAYDNYIADKRLSLIRRQENGVIG